LFDYWDLRIGYSGAPVEDDVQWDTIICSRLERCVKAILLLAFGGPHSLEEVEFFMTQLFRSRRPSPEHLEKVKERYRLIGGSSPLPQITQKQAKRLEEKLNAKGYPFKSYVGMRYGHPLIEETLKEISQNEITDIIALPMTPFQSRTSTGTYIEEVDRVRKTLDKEISISFVVGWHLHPLFLEAVQEKIEEGLMQFTPEERKGVHLIFTAHSLPVSFVKSEPYVRDIEESVRELIKKIRPLPWHIAFQSKGLGSEEWLGPEVESVLTDLFHQKVREVLIIPIGFVSDHLEILYDIDILYQEKAQLLGLILKRVPSLNYSERFIEALATIVEEHMDSRIRGV
jgi:ferrochelatase